MTNFIKVAMTVALFTGSLMADGQMGSGGRNCPGAEGCPPPCTENCGRPAIEEGITVKIVKGIASLYFSRF